ncbi:MAG: hypothetical protein PVI40_00030 [Chlamydiota bacterium]|jgi:hypothetical protein
MKEKSLTNESLRKHFTSDFDLANFAIKLARNFVLSHEGATINDVLEELSEVVAEK